MQEPPTAHLLSAAIPYLRLCNRHTVPSAGVAGRGTCAIATRPASLRSQSEERWKRRSYRGAQLPGSLQALTFPVTSPPGNRQPSACRCQSLITYTQQANWPPSATNGSGTRSRVRHGVFLLSLPACVLNSFRLTPGRCNGASPLGAAVPAGKSSQGVPASRRAARHGESYFWGYPSEGQGMCTIILVGAAQCGCE